jgi:hypothetical protein
MAMLSKAEKRELLRLAASTQLRKDFALMRETNLSRSRKLAANADNYLKFVTFTNAFANHKRKKFRKITGNHFIL